MSKSRPNDLTEMEGLALGLVKMLQPVSAYALAVAFGSSPSDYWSGSAGAIYPLVRRLHKAKLLSARKAATGKRESTVYALAPAGEAAFQTWLLDADRAVNPGFDPLRSRLSMIQLAPPRAGKAFLEDVGRKFSEQRRTPLPKEHASRWFRRLHESWFNHRIQWLKELRRLIQTD